MLNLQRVRLLVELRRRGTLAEVARALSFSPSSVSAQLSQLQVEAGVQLTEPVGRGLRLTAAGEILARHGEAILEQVDRAEADLAATRSEIIGDLRVAMFQTAAYALIPDLLDLVSNRHPGLDLYLSEIQPDTASAALLAREFDLVLGEHYPGRRDRTSPGIEQRRLLADPLHLYVGSTWPDEGARELTDFADAHWVFEPEGKPARAWAENTCRAAGFEPVVRYESADLWVHAQMAETGRALALLPDLVWASRQPVGRFVELPGRPTREVFTAVRAGAETRPALVAVRSALEEVADRQALGAREAQHG